MATGRYACLVVLKQGVPRPCVVLLVARLLQALINADQVHRTEQQWQVEADSERTISVTMVA
jgi:hypothetical protein